METTLGGDRLGSGNKQKLSMRNFERSTHDLSYIWRSTMAPGTLVPFMTEVGLPGDTFDIDLDVNVMTHPTIGPLFGSFKIQMDVFAIPIRLYNAKLHMNKLGIGMDMKSIKLPQMEVTAEAASGIIKTDNDQINPSCLLSYLNIRGIGTTNSPTKITKYRWFNAVPYLAYWDIYKNYYANKQEEVGYLIHNTRDAGTQSITEAAIYSAYNGTKTVFALGVSQQYSVTSSSIMALKCSTTYQPAYSQIKWTIGGVDYSIDEIFKQVTFDRQGTGGMVKGLYPNEKFTNVTQAWIYKSYDGKTQSSLLNPPGLKQFDLVNIDTMREDILSEVQTPTPFPIDATTYSPYGEVFQKGTEDLGLGAFCKLAAMEGLAVKTYQSDLFNNWISTEWIDGTNGINEITSIDTSGGSFNIDTLNLSNKVYNMLNRIAISGGSYDDWLDAVYTHERVRSVENPVYHGGLIRELAFEEVVSLAGTEDNPLGTLAGRGAMTGKKKGGNIRIKVDEPSYIMGIISLTPRLDYSQGNKWDVNLKTMDDFHKPSLDEIGFQDLVTEQMAWWDTDLETDGTVTLKSAGKQPAWINYMTNVNQTRGNFASKEQQMWMTLNRRYEYNNGAIKDLTTYIDPVKYNNIFADTSYDAQNFWVQISNNITARRKMSAKIIPNL